MTLCKTRFHFWTIKNTKPRTEKSMGKYDSKFKCFYNIYNLMLIFSSKNFHFISLSVYYWNMTLLPWKFCWGRKKIANCSIYISKESDYELLFCLWTVLSVKSVISHCTSVSTPFLSWLNAYRYSAWNKVIIVPKEIQPVHIDNWSWCVHGVMSLTYSKSNHISNPPFVSVTVMRKYLPQITYSICPTKWLFFYFI